MKKPVTSYGSIDATLADTCSYYYSSSAETSPESSSEDLITRSSSNNNNQHQHQHQHRPHGKASTSNAVLMVDFMTFSGRTRSKDRCYKYLLSLLLIIIIIILIVWLLLVVASSFLAAFWSHFHWKLPFWSSSQNIGQEQGVEEYDYIIVGAGPAGLVVAFHLAKRLQQESIKAYGTNDHAGKVLVLESGRESQSDVMKVLLHDGTSSHGFVKDARDGNHYSQQQDKSSWTFVGGGLNKFDVPFLWSELSSRDDWSEYLSHHWPVDQTFLGRAVGGSGIHNAMINVRALPNDFQKWNVTNWSADEMMPYFDKLEDYHGTIPIVANYSPPLPKPFSRGSNGPLKTVVGGGMAISPLCAYFISSAVAAGFPLATLGFNDAEALNRIGVGFYEFNIRNGIRDSVAKALLSSPPQQQGGTSTIPSNLIIRTDATVHRVIFETLTTVPRAVGVEYYSNQQTVGGSFRRHVRLRSSRSVSNLHPIPIQHDPEVILSAGAILSSQILANSGISKGGFLVDSPNVGNNLQDHPVVAISYRVMGDLSNSISSFFQMDGSNSQLSFETYLKSFPNNNHSTRYDATNFLSNSVYGTAGFSVGGFLSSPWSKDGDHVPDIQITVFPHTREPHFMHNNHNLTLTAQQSSHNNTNSIANVTGTNILITVALLQPESRNSLVMVAAAAATAYDTKNSPEQSWSSLGNFPLPQIQGGSLTNGDASRLAWGIKQVRNIMSTSPLKDVIQYEQRPGDQCTQDQDLIQYVKDNVMRNAHWSGSTRMGNDDDDESDSVVDSRLRVRGVESLRIVDAGVMPLIPNGNTHSTTCVIALRAVDLILDQGLKK